MRRLVNFDGGRSLLRTEKPVLYRGGNDSDVCARGREAWKDG
jgi:hypothetical protein